MPLPEINPAHIYRTCLRECGYLPLPQCRSYMRDFTIKSFRNFIPRQSLGKGPKPPKLSSEKITRLLHVARKHASVLRRANQGYLVQLEKILRISYGRVGPRKYELLAKYLYPSTTDLSAETADLLIHTGNEDKSRPKAHDGSEDADELEELLEDNEPEEKLEKDTLYPSLSPTVSTSTTAFTTFYTPAKGPKPRSVESSPPKWKQDLPPRLHALLTSQSAEQGHFARTGITPRVKLKFSPPAQTIWGKPLPLSRYKNQRTKWYNENMKAAIPPLGTDAEYRDLHDLVTGKQAIPALVPRRIPAERTSDDTLEQYIEEQAEEILEGPKFGPRLKDVRRGRPHEITTKLLQRMLSRAVLSHTPLVSVARPEIKTEGDSGLVFFWDDGLSAGRFSRAQEELHRPAPKEQARLLFA